MPKDSLNRALIAVGLGLILSLPPVWSEYIGFTWAGFWSELLGLWEADFWDPRYLALRLSLPVLSLLGLNLVFLDSQGVINTRYGLRALLVIYFLAIISSVFAIVTYSLPWNGQAFYGSFIEALEYEGPALVGIVPAVLLLQALREPKAAPAFFEQQSQDKGSNLDSLSESSDKDWLALLLLCFFFGGLGIHRFYVGKVGTGILQLFTLGGLGIWVVIDFITIIIGSFKDKNERFIRRNESASMTGTTLATSQEKTIQLALKTSEKSDLTSDAYKLYLAEKYAIKRNDVFEKYVCDDKMFDQLDTALAHANQLETLQLKPSTLQGQINDLNAAITFLRSRGYRVRTRNQKYRIYEPAGGRTKWKNNEELLEYASGRGFGK